MQNIVFFKAFFLNIKKEYANNRLFFVSLWCKTKKLENKIQQFDFQAACIWLLALVKTCSFHEALQANLLQIQAAFMKMLSENDGKLSVSR